jgi:hypothetical protein
LNKPISFQHIGLLSEVNDDLIEFSGLGGIVFCDIADV